MKISRYAILSIFILTSIACGTEVSQTVRIQSLNDKNLALAPTEFEDFIKKQMDSLNIPAISIAVINDSKVVFHRALGVSNIETQEKIDENSIFEAASLTKPVFSFFTLKMMEKSIIDLDRPLHFYLEDEDMSKDDRYKNVSARMVLNHTSGFPNWRWFDPAPPEMNIERGDFYMKSDPGIFTYSGEAYQYLARVLAHNNFVNLYELANLFHSDVARPLSMKHAYIVWDDYLYDHKVFGHKNEKVDTRYWGTGLPQHHSKILGAAGGLHTEARSYAQFLIALLEEKGLYHSTFAEMFAEQVMLPKDHRFYINENTKAWGLGIAIEEDGENTYYKHGGNNGGFMSGFLINKKSKNGYVYFMNCDKGKEFDTALRNFLKL